MKVNSEYNKNISFNGFWNNKCVKKGLEFASDYGALFAATTTLVLSSGIRPLVISKTPNTDSENKKIAAAKSIVSGGVEFLLTLALSLPIVAGLKKIEANPQKFLNKEALRSLKSKETPLKDSSAYSLATQLFKLGIGFAVVLPKAIITATGIPYINEKLLNSSNSNNISNKPVFKGKSSEKIANIISKFLNNKKTQKFANKYQDSNFPLHIFALKDLFATGAFISQANKSKKIKDEQKDFLIINSIISTALSLLSSYTIDNITDKPAKKIIKKIKLENKNDPKLHKYIEGFKIIKPILILATVYYTIIPFLSTLWADKLKFLLAEKSKTINPQY